MDESPLAAELSFPSSLSSFGAMAFDVRVFAALCAEGVSILSARSLRALCPKRHEIAESIAER